MNKENCEKQILITPNTVVICIGRRDETFFSDVLDYCTTANTPIFFCDLETALKIIKITEMNILMIRKC